VVLANLLEEPKRGEFAGDLRTERAGGSDDEEAVEPLRAEKRHHRLGLPGTGRHDDGAEIVRHGPMRKGRVERTDLGRAQSRSLLSVDLALSNDRELVSPRVDDGADGIAFC